MSEGDLLDHGPESPRHDRAVDMLAGLLQPLEGRGYAIQKHRRLRADTLDMPSPDLAVTGDSQMDLTPNRVAHAVFEVAETSGHVDLHFKAPKYAAAGIPLYVVVDIEDRYTMVHTEPGSESYGAVQRGDYMTVLGVGIDLATLYDA